MKLTYDGISPFTQNETLLKEYDEIADDYVCMCMDTGYQTYEKLWKEGSEALKKYEETAPVFVLKTRKKLEDGSVWFKAGDVNRYGRGLLLPSIDDTGKDIWTVFKTQPVAASDPTYVYTIQLTLSGSILPVHIGLVENSKQIFDGSDFGTAYDTYLNTCGMTADE